MLENLRVVSAWFPIVQCEAGGHRVTMTTVPCDDQAEADSTLSSSSAPRSR